MIEVYLDSAMSHEGSEKKEKAKKEGQKKRRTQIQYNPMHQAPSLLLGFIKISMNQKDIKATKTRCCASTLDDPKKRERNFFLLGCTKIKTVIGQLTGPR